MQETVLKMENITKRFVAVTALDDVSMDLLKGEILAVVGENGAGKSTLMKILSGSYSSGSYEGTIKIHDRPVTFNSTRDAEHEGIEMIYQEISLHADLSIAENIFLGNLPRRKLKGFVDTKKMISLSREAMSLVGLDVDVLEPVGRLSTSQQQLVSIAKALYRKPKVLVLDEPTSALTLTETDSLMAILKSLRDQGISCVYISHKLDEVFEIADRLMILRDGKVISVYPREEIKAGRVIEDMVGRKIENMYPKSSIPLGEELLRVENITIPSRVPFKYLLEDVSFTLREGEILGLGGLVGAGRSELVNAIFGSDPRVTGTVHMQGGVVADGSPETAIKLGLGLVTEDRKKSGFVGPMNLRENISLASLEAIKGSMFIRKSRERTLTQEQFDKLRIRAPGIETNIMNLSGGNQQKVVMAKWLMADAKVLILDEPTRGIDVGAKVEIYKLMDELVRQGAGIIMISSELPELIAMCDRFIVLYKGRVRGEFSREEITEQLYMQAATGIL
jgi:ABC-type sugar transport system ATPase subunit